MEESSAPVPRSHTWVSVFLLRYGRTFKHLEQCKIEMGKMRLALGLTEEEEEEEEGEMEDGEDFPPDEELLLEIPGERHFSFSPIFIYFL